MCIDTSASHVAVFDTSEGEIRVTLNAAETPITVNNFVTLARWGYYDGTAIFPGDPSIDIIQGGAPHQNPPSDPGPGYDPDEPQFEETSAGIVGPYLHRADQLVMARTALPNSSSAQYFFYRRERRSARRAGRLCRLRRDRRSRARGAAVDHRPAEPGGALGVAPPSRTVTVNSVTIEVSDVAVLWRQRREPGPRLHDGRNGAATRGDLEAVHIAYEETRPTNRLRDVAIEVQPGDRPSETSTDTECPTTWAGADRRLEHVHQAAGRKQFAESTVEAVEIASVRRLEEREIVS